jgi:hypothetical protein
MFLERLEVGDAGRKNKGDLPVEKRLATGEAFKRFCNRGEAYGPIKPASAEERDVAPRSPRDDAITVEFRLMQPVFSRWDIVDEGRKLRRDEFRLYRPAGFRRRFAVPAEGLFFGLFFSAFDVHTGTSPVSISCIVRPLLTLVS